MLDIDNETVRVLDLDSRHDLPLTSTDKDTVSKVGYIEAQIEQMKAVLWRMRVDYVILAKAATETEDQTEEKATKLKTNRKEMDQFKNALSVLDTLKSELEA